VPVFVKGKDKATHLVGKNTISVPLVIGHEFVGEVIDNSRI
jgi:D-arabinose 1-dehydrogenase-like Zn-dependent alcohol dehydrogenase